MSGALPYIKQNCPLLYERMKEDEEKGWFDFSWSVVGPNSRSYIGDLLGRQIIGHENIYRTFDEIERRLQDGDA